MSETTMPFESDPGPEPLPTPAPWLVSVVVPTRNSEDSIAACVASIAAQTYPHVEIIVVDRESADRTAEIARTMGATVLQAEPERSAQRNVGARAARGRWVLFVDSDMILSRELVQSCVDRATHSSVALVIPERAVGRGWLGRLRALEKDLYVGNENVEAARFFPRSQFLALGGYDETLTGPEDWDITDRWRRQPADVARVSAVVYHNDGSLTLRSLIRKRFFYGRNFVPAIRKDRSAIRHLRPGRFVFNPTVIRRQPIAFIGLLALKVMESIAFGAGALAGYLRSDGVAGAGRLPR